MRKISKKEKIAVVILIVLNFIVLLGHIWPEGAPPFAQIVNISFLVLSLLFFVYLLIKHKFK